MGRILLISLSLFTVIFGALPVHAEITATEQRIGHTTLIEVATPHYRVAIDPGRSGRIAEYIPAGTTGNLAYGYLIGGIGRVGTVGDWDLSFTHEVVRMGGRLEVRLTSGEANRQAMDGLEISKTYVFTDDTPLIHLTVHITNHGAGKPINWRMYNEFVSPADATAACFLNSAEGQLVNTAQSPDWKIWPGAGTGVGGVHAAFGYSVVVGVPPSSVAETVTFATPSYSAYELRFTTATLDTGESRTVGIFLGALPTDKLPSQFARLGETTAGLADTGSATAASNDVVLTDESNRVLIAGRYDRYKYYGVERALAQMPAFRDRVDVALADFLGRHAHVLMGFPVSARRISVYKMMVFIDVPYHAVAPESWNLVAEYVRAGGTVVFVGDHAVGFQDTPIETMIPAQFDYAKQTQGLWHKVSDDRTPYATLAVNDPADPLVRGLDYAARPQATVHGNTPREGATVHLHAGANPVLTSWRVGKGTVISFPVCLTDRYIAIWDNDEPETDFLNNTPRAGERAQSLFHWQHYDDLWRRLASTVLYGSTAPDIMTFSAERTDQGRKLRVDYTVANAAPRSRAVLVMQTSEGSSTKRVVPLHGGRGSVVIGNLSPTQEIDYALSIMDGDRELARRDGRIGRDAPPPFALSIGEYQGLCRVFRRDHDVPYAITCTEGVRDSALLELWDPWGKVVWRRRVLAGQGSGTIPLRGLACGRYQVRAALGGHRETYDIHILPDFDARDAFYITTLPQFFTADDPGDVQQMLAEAREAGLNTVRTTDLYRRNPEFWPVRNKRTLADQAMIAGMLPVHSQAVGPLTFSHDFHLSGEKLRADVHEAVAFIDSLWDMAPRGILTYIYDEPSHVDKCQVCHDEYAARYGEPIPEKPQDHGYYRLQQIKEEAMIRSLQEKSALLHELNADGRMATIGFTNEGGGFVSSALHLARAFPGYGMDLFIPSPQGWTAQFSFDMALAACDFTPNRLGFQLEADSYFGSMQIAAQRGQMVYNALGRGAQWIGWFDWDLTRIKARMGITPERYACVKRASAEAASIGPVVAGVTRPRARVVMLAPTATQTLANAENGYILGSLLAPAYKAVQVACGNVDFLYYPQVLEGKLAAYDLLVLAGSDWIDEQVLEAIVSWVEAGGTLMVMPKSGMTNTERSPTRLFAERCPISFGPSVDAAVVGLDSPPAIAFSLQSTAGTVLHTYANGEAASRLFQLGKGAIAVFGFIPARQTDMEKLFATLGKDPAIVRSADNDASAFLLRDGGAYYCIAVNSENREKTATLTLNVEIAGKPVALDMLTGTPLPIRRNAAGRLELDVALEPFWGRAIALLPEMPERIAVQTPSKAVRGASVQCLVTLRDGQGRAVSGRYPAQVSVKDASGKERPEFSGRKIITNGQLSLPIALAANDPRGRWTIAVTDAWTDLTARAVLYVR
jgi:hypothetical protein